MSSDESGAVILSPREDEKGTIRLSVHIHIDGAGGGRAGYASPSGRGGGWVLPVIVVFGVGAAVWFGGRAVATRIAEAKLGAPTAAGLTFADNGADRQGEMPQALANALKEPAVVSPGPGVKSGQPSGPAAFGLSE